MIDKAKLLTVLERLDQSATSIVTAEEMATIAEGAALTELIQYLVDHRLVTADIRSLDGEVTWAKITSKGRDYISADGGLTQELGVVTVKLHEDTLRQIFINRVKASDADSSVKGKLIDQIKALPAEGLSKLVEKALEEGLRYMPHALQWLQTAQWS